MEHRTIAASLFCASKKLGIPMWLLGKKKKKNPMQEMQEMWIQLLGQKNSLEEEMVTHPSILAWKISWTEEPGGLQSMGLQRVRHD